MQIDLYPYGGTDPLGMFPLFLMRTADAMAPPRLSIVFRLLVRLSSFPACWRKSNVNPIPKCPPSSSVANCRPISITSVLSKPLRWLSVWCLFVAVVCFQPPSLLIGKIWVPVMHFSLLCNSSTASREGTPELNSSDFETSLFLHISSGVRAETNCKIYTNE